MTVKRIVSPNKWIGLASDTKPTQSTDSRVRDGDTFYEYDTDLLWVTYDGATWVIKSDKSSGGVIKTVSVTKVIATAGAYLAERVVSENTSTGTDWDFTAIAKENGGSGYIVKAHVLCETTAITPRMSLYLFTAAPGCALNDNAANTALLWTDLANYVGKIDFPAMEDLGTGKTEAVATPSTFGSLPMAFTCASTADDLFGVLVARDAVTIGVGDDVVIRLTVEQV